MIKFKKVKFKNFLSSGNQFQEIDLDKDKVTVIVGANGSGKTTCITAIFYGLYGKAFSKSVNSSLINHINKGKTEVILEFSVNDIEYRVHRGLKPNFLKIYQNDKLVPEMPNVKDYQNWLINDVVKINERTFRQLVLLGSTQYTPFLRLSTNDRRIIIEEILGLESISEMAKIAKENLSNIQKNISNLNNSFAIENNKLEMHRLRLNEIEKSGENIKEADDLIIKIKKNIKSLLTDAEKTKQELEEVTESFEREFTSDAEKLLNEIIKKIASTKNDISHYKKLKEPYTKSNCPYCKQDIEKSFANKQLENLENEINKKEDEYEILLQKSKELEKQVTNLRNLFNNKQQYEFQYKSIKSELKTAKENLIRSQEQKERYIQKNSEKKNEIEQDINTQKRICDNIKEEIKKETKKVELYKSIIDMLKDTGIKSYIIKNYLGAINLYMRKYIEIVGLNITCTFDENFNEVIKVKGREELEYSGFSSGERCKIDLAILYMLRDLAELRNSVRTNLLIQDEIGESTLDQSGIDAQISLFNQTKQNIIFITHHLQDYEALHFNRIIKVQKNNGFSRYEIE